MKQSRVFRFIVFVDLMPVIENNRIARAQLYDLLAKLNTYDHIERIFVMNSPSDRPADVPSDELFQNPVETKKQYYMFNQMAGTSDFFNKVLNIDQNYQLNQAQTSDIVYITSQDNLELANLRQIYAQILNPNVITIKLNTQSTKSAIEGIQEFVEFLTLNRKPLGVRVASGALPADIQGKVLAYVDKYRPQDPRRIVTVYPAADKYREHNMDRAIFNMYLTDADTELVGRIGSVSKSATARFLAKLLTGKSEFSGTGPVKRGLASKLRRFTHKVLGRVSSRRQQQKAFNREFPIHKSSRRQSSRKSKKSANPDSRAIDDDAFITNQLKQAAKYLEEIERLDTLIAESGKSRQQKQKTTSQRTIIEDINRQYQQHRNGFVMAIRALFNTETETAKSRLHTLYSSTANSKTKQLLSRLIRVLDDKAFINIHSVNKKHIPPSVNTIMKDYKDTLQQNIAANPGFFRKLTRKRILGQINK